MPTNKKITLCCECEHCFESRRSKTGYACAVWGHDDFADDTVPDGFCHKAKPHTTYTLSRDGSKIVSRNKTYLDTILSQIKKCVEWYGIITLADLKDIVNQGWTVRDSKYGWIGHMVENIELVHTSEGWVLELPRASLIE